MDKMMRDIAMCGMLGGLVSAILAAMAKIRLIDGIDAWLEVVCYLILGGVAALIGVYLVTASDLTQKKTLIFAILCGIAWKPIIDGGLQIVNNFQAVQTATSLEAHAGALGAAMKSGTTSDAAVKVEETAQRVVQVVEKAAGTETPGVADSLNQSAVVAIEALGRAQESAPEATISSLQQIAQTASAPNQRPVRETAVQELRRIRESAATESTRMQAGQALERISP